MTAVRASLNGPDASILSLMGSTHSALRSTRGAAVAIAEAATEPLEQPVGVQS